MTARNVLVTGGAGYIGSHTVRELIANGNNVIVYDDLSCGHKFAVSGVNHINGDIGDYDLMKKTLIDNKIDVVVHFAAVTLVGESVSNPKKYYENNIVKGMSLLDAVIDSDVKKIVFSSSCATYGTPTKVPIDESEKQIPINPYGWTKLMFEQIMKDYDSAYGLKSVCLRYFNAAGADVKGDIGEKHAPETHVIPLLLQTAMGLRESFSVFGTDYNTKDGSCVRDYVHVTDLASAHMKAIDYLFNNNKSDQFNLGTGDGVTVLELIDSVERITGVKLNIKKEGRRAGDPAKLVADTTKASTALGWTPVHSSIDNIVKTAWVWHIGLGHQ
jgi:UDP-glucose-4-epimerase